METKPKPYLYKRENEATRMALREHPNWYYQQGYTGAEAFRACKIVLKRWLKFDPDNHYLKYLIDSIGTIDIAPYMNFALALEEVMDERNAVAEDGVEVDILPIPRDLDSVYWKDCTCCNQCMWGPWRQQVKPYLKYTPPTEETK